MSSRSSRDLLPLVITPFTAETMPSAVREPVGDSAKPHVTSVREWLDSTKLKGKKDGYGNQEYLRDDDLIGRVRKLRQSLGLEV